MAKPKRKEEPRGLDLEDQEYVRRAIAAYFRTGGPNLPIPVNTSSVQEHEGKFYVELHNAVGTLAVYRIRRDGMLKRLKRWPLEVEQTVEAATELERRELAEKARTRKRKS